MASVTEELKELAALLREDLITREQFEAKRDRLMAEDEASSLRTASVSSPGVPNQVGAYRITGHIGDGGMGTVYRGQHRSAEFAAKQGGEVAIKVMHPHIARNQDFAERFEREAGLGLKLDHPGICKVHELIMDGGVLALVMELVDGDPLSEVIGSKTGPIPWERAWPMFEQLLEAVGYMHSQGVLHRDIKPENVLVTPGGKLKLLDLGIAKDTGSGKTRTGVGMGTVDYMAPEQHTDAGKVDERADVYSLGMTLYEMLAGQLPWGETLDAVMVLQCKLSGQIPPPTDFYPDIAPEVVAALMGALATEREDRTSGAAALAEAFREASAGTELRPEPEKESARKQPEKKTGLSAETDNARPPAAAEKIDPAATPVPEIEEDELTPVDPVAASVPSVPVSSSEGAPTGARESRGGRGRWVRLGLLLGLLLSLAAFWMNTIQTNANEVRASIDSLRGGGPSDSWSPPPDAPDPSYHPSPPEGAPSPPATRMPSGKAKIQVWLESSLSGRDNRMAAHRSVKIKKRGDGYRISVANQFNFRCGLEFDARGQPAVMTKCKSKGGGWFTRTKKIKLSCRLFDNKQSGISPKEECWGEYQLCTEYGCDPREMYFFRRL